MKEGDWMELLFPFAVATFLLVVVALAVKLVLYLFGGPPDETCLKCVQSCVPFQVASCRPYHDPHLDSPMRVECVCAVAVDGGTP